MRYLSLATIASSLALLASQPCSAATITSASGTFSVRFVVTTKTAVPASGQVWCHVRVFNPSSGPTFFADGNMLATLESGFYFCALAVPFSWVGEVGGTATPTTFVADAFIIDAANTNLAVDTLFLQTVRHAEQDGFGPELIQGNNGTVTLPQQNITM